MRQYEVEFIDGGSEILTANLVSENVIARVDDKGFEHMMLDEIEDHCILEDAIPKGKRTFITKYSTKRKKQTTCGWELMVRWKHNLSNWVGLQNLKESYPIEVAEYAIRNKIHEAYKS